MSNESLPKFLIPGVAKAGTTSLFFYLNDHPEIYIPLKETFFFCNEAMQGSTTEDPAARKVGHIVSEEEEYRKLHDEKPEGAISGEISTAYFYYYEMVIPKILRLLGPDVKIAIILRNPVDRAISGYQHFRRDYFETYENLLQAIEQEQTRMDMGWDFMWSYKSLGLYYEAAKSFISSFNSVRFYLYDDFESDPRTFMRSLFEYVGVDPAFESNFNKKFNASSGVRSRFVHNLMANQENFLKRAVRPLVRSVLNERMRYIVMQNIKRLNYQSRPSQTISEEIIQTLREGYREDILKTQDLTKLDLGKWL